MMERLLVLRLHSNGCAAEARLNGIAVARTAAGRSATLAVHEYLLEGVNEVVLVVEPSAFDAPVLPRQARAAMSASLLLLLPRLGCTAGEHTARGLAQLDWSVDEGACFTPPVERRLEVSLPVKFPRWRWIDLPPLVDPRSRHSLVAAFVQSMAVSLARGDADAFVAAARPRFEDLAIAYQQREADLVARWRSRIHLLQATKALHPVLPALTDIVLRPCAGARLLECLSPAGEPALRTEPAPDGSRQAWPLRVAVVDERCIIVR